MDANEEVQDCCSGRLPNVALESADDLLIALEAAQAGATLVTENARDFARWKSLLASTRKTLKLFDPSRVGAEGES